MVYKPYLFSYTYKYAVRNAIYSSCSRHSRLVQRRADVMCCYNGYNVLKKKQTLAVICIILRLAESLNISISTIMQHYYYFIDISSFNAF